MTLADVNKIKASKCHSVLGFVVCIIENMSSQTVFQR